MEKPTAIGSIPERKSILPKPLTPAGHGVGSSALGAKIPAHMTPEDKTNFLRRLEEYRKNKLQSKQDMAGKTKIPSIIPLIVKTKTPGMNLTKSSEKEIPKLEIKAAQKDERREISKEGTTGEAHKVEKKEAHRFERKEVQKEERKETLKNPNHDVLKVNKQEIRKEEKPVQKVERKDVKKDGNKEEKENVFERLFRKSTRVSLAKTVEKFEPKMEPPPKPRPSVKPKRPNSSSSLKSLGGFKAPEPKSKDEGKIEVEPKAKDDEITELKPKDDVIVEPEPIPKDSINMEPETMPKGDVNVEPEPMPKGDVNVELEPMPKGDVNKEPEPMPKGDVNMEPKDDVITEPKPKPEDDLNMEPELKSNDDVRMELEPKGNVCFWIPDEKTEAEPIPTPKDNVKIVSELGSKPSPNEEKILEEKIPEPEIIVEVTTKPNPEENKEMEIDPPEIPKTEERLPAIVISKPDDDILINEIPVSEVKPGNKKPTVKFSSAEKPVKKAAIQKKPSSTVTRKSLSTKTQEKAKKSDKEEKEKKVKIRRSISMIHRKKIGNAESAIHRTVSEHDLSFTEPELEIKRPAEDEDYEKRRRSKSVSFVTPKAKTPPNASCLRDKLEEWLHSRGHSISGYRHLNCFGVNPNANVTPVFQTPRNRFNDTLEQSQYATAPNTPLEDSDKENMTPTPATAIQRIDIKEAEGWLTDLHKLIVELKYPHNRCEEWLAAIRRKCIGVTQLPCYWECLAALEESRGETTTAIEYYERAIIKGAEVKSVEDSLEHLFDKLMIDQKNKVPYAKADKNVDPKNIFKSTIIKFALQQKAVKELEPEIGTKAKQQLYVATPVRRSSRIQTPYKPHVVSSLKSLDPELKDSVEFQTNKFLLTEK